jgi:hypothetical protein
MKDLSVKTIVRDFIIIMGLTGIAGLYTSLAMPGKLGTIEHASTARLLTLLLVTMGFTIIACLSPKVRWRQLLIVTALACIVDALYNLLLLTSPSRIFFQNTVHFVITMLVGGVFSYVFTGGGHANEL